MALLVCCPTAVCAVDTMLPACLAVSAAVRRTTVTARATTPVAGRATRTTLRSTVVTTRRARAGALRPVRRTRLATFRATRRARGGPLRPARRTRLATFRATTLRATFLFTVLRRAVRRTAVLDFLADLRTTLFTRRTRAFATVLRRRIFRRAFFLAAM